MGKYFLEISYQGTPFNGFAKQIEGNPITVQDELEEALSVLLKEKIVTITSSRTDASVHAKQNFLHFETEIPIPENILYKLNAILHPAISTKNIYLVPDNAHARFDALTREYQYHICLAKEPALIDAAWYYPFKIDTQILHTTAAIIGQYQDFTSFSKKNTQVHTHNCIIHESRWHQENSNLTYYVSANRFLRGMVRALVATQIRVAVGKISIDDFVKIIEQKKAATAEFGAPGWGLFLEKVNYRDELLIKPIADSLVLRRF